ncbi:MAG: DUF3343 domain-containing protein [Cyanobacteria bacterium SZAS LIN-3]|nr:DUF3343 domain-containing protein [Cyanobacteria bacterium SZAS LIN-3]
MVRPEIITLMRLIFTFPTLHKLLAAEKALRSSEDERLRCRPTPTPPALSADICGMSLELMQADYRDLALSSLEKAKLSPLGSHLVP